MNKYVCPSCGEPFDLEQARFCPHCGTALPEETTEFAVEKLETAIRESYRAYAGWTEGACAKEGGVRRLLSLFTGTSSFKKSERHGQFFEEVKSLSETLLTMYRENPGMGNMSGLLQFVLLDCHGRTKKEADWMFIAAEQLYLPFLELLSAQEAADLFPKYYELRKKSRDFAYQEEILKKLKTMGNM